VRLRDRLSVAFLFLAFFTLVDEYVKESYIFDPRDLLASFPTHEQLFIVFLVIGLVLGLRR
jgi:hypothetical protein